MKNDISAIGNALVDTVFKVEHSLISELGLEIDQMTLSSAEEHAPIIERLIASRGNKSFYYWGMFFRT